MKNTYASSYNDYKCSYGFVTQRGEGIFVKKTLFFEEVIKFRNNS